MKWKQVCCLFQTIYVRRSVEQDEYRTFLVLLGFYQGLSTSAARSDRKFEELAVTVFCCNGECPDAAGGIMGVSGVDCASFCACAYRERCVFLIASHEDRAVVE